MENTLSFLGEDFYKSIENKIIYIDSNIFMEEKFKNLLLDFANFKLNIIIPKEQYDEIYNLKKDTQEKGKKARDSFKIIEKFLDLGILTIDGINQNYVKKNAYADLKFIDYINQNIKNQEQVIFFTDDADLRIRIKTLNEADLFVKTYGFNELHLLSEDEKKRIEMKEREEQERISNEEREEYLRDQENKEMNKTTFDKFVDGVKVAGTVALGTALVGAYVYTKLSDFEDEI